MQRIINDQEISGLPALLGERVALWCERYIYAGELVGVGPEHVELRGASVVYETGPLDDEGFADAQPLPHDVTWHVSTRKIESYGRMK